VSDDDVDDSYSEVATEQLDALEVGEDPELYNAVLETCELVFNQPGRAQSLSAAITTKEGIRFRLAVDGHYPYKVFWSSDGPRIEAVFPYPS
jgi:hypothetical protein